MGTNESVAPLSNIPTVGGRLWRFALMVFCRMKANFVLGLFLIFKMTSGWKHTRLDLALVMVVVLLERGYPCLIGNCSL